LHDTQTFFGVLIVAFIAATPLARCFARASFNEFEKKEKKSEFTAETPG
jgi:hypothetical protein